MASTHFESVSHVYMQKRGKCTLKTTDCQINNYMKQVHFVTCRSKLKSLNSALSLEIRSSTCCPEAKRQRENPIS